MRAEMTYQEVVMDCFEIISPHLDRRTKWKRGTSGCLQLSFQTTYLPRIGKTLRGIGLVLCIIRIYRGYRAFIFHVIEVKKCVL